MPGRKGSTTAAVGGHRRPAGARATGRSIAPSAVRYAPQLAGAARDDARRHGPRARRLRARPRGWASTPASTCSSCTARTATCSRASSRRSATSAPTSTAARSRTGCAFRSRSFAPCARSGRRSGRCRCASRRPTGSRAASPARTRSLVARAFVDAGADIIHVSTGQTSVDAKPVYGRMYQTPFSDQIRNEAASRRSPSATSPSADQVNCIIAAGRADLCALARPHLTRSVLDAARRRPARLRGPAVAGAVPDRPKAARARAERLR